MKNQKIPNKEKQKMLHLVRTSPREFYARDRNNIINAACGLLGKEYSRPLDALHDVIKLMGFKVARWRLPGDQRACVFLDKREVVLASNLARKLDYPESLPGVEAFALAQQVAHIRLHLFDGVEELLPAHKEEARHYAGVFLVTRRHLTAHPSFLDMLEAGRLGLNLWGYVGELASYFGVSRSCLARQLEELHYVIHDRETRTLKLAA